MKKRSDQPAIVELTWEQIKKDIHPICEKLANIIDEINPSDDMTFIKVKYPFGSKIIHNGIANFPLETNEIVPITDTRLPELVRTKIDYNRVPLGFNTKGRIEVFGEIDSRIFSVAARRQGLDIGIWEYFDWKTTPYTVTAGARSFYLLPKVTLAQSHKRLKRYYNVTSPPPKQYFDHWHLFRQIVNSPSFIEQWNCEVIYFTNKWANKLSSDDYHWNKLHNYVLNQGWLHSDYARKRSILDILWEVFARSLNLKGLKPSSYILDTLKHLALVGLGVLPASQPTKGSGMLGPTDGIQQAYIEAYGLKDYIPTIMQPGYFSLEKGSRPVYYSLQTPTLLESVPQSRYMISIIDNIRELKDLADHFLSEAFDPDLMIGKINIAEFINQIKFEFFHEATYAYGNDIRPASEMPKGDAALVYMLGDPNGRVFAETAPFLHGCVRISRRNDV